MLDLLDLFSKCSIEVAAHDLLSWLFAGQTSVDGLASPEADGLQLQNTSPVTLSFFCTGSCWYKASRYGGNYNVILVQSLIFV